MCRCKWPRQQRRPFPSFFCSCRLELTVGCPWQGEAERASLAVLTLHRYPASHDFDKLLGECQPEAGPLPGAVRQGLRLHKDVEDTLLVFLLDADAGINHADLTIAVLGGGLDGNSPALRGKLDGVAEEVEEHLFYLSSISIGLRQALRNTDHDFVAALVGHRFNGPYCLANHIGQVQILRPQVHLPCFHLGEIEYATDKGQQVLPAGQDVIKAFLLLVVDLTGDTINQQLGEADDGVERGAQLVGHAGQELGLRLACLFELPGLLYQLLLGLLALGDVSRDANDPRRIS